VPFFLFAYRLGPIKIKKNCADPKSMARFTQKKTPQKIGKQKKAIAHKKWENGKAIAFKKTGKKFSKIKKKSEI